VVLLAITSMKANMPTLLQRLPTAALLGAAMLLVACGGGSASPSENAGVASADSSAKLAMPAMPIVPATPTALISGHPRAVANTRTSYQASTIGGTATGISWNWGDGSVDSGAAIVQKLWRKPGSFISTFSATISAQTVTASLAVAVVGAPVAAGYFHSCTLRPNGNVLCWGNNNVGQLGNGTIVSSNTLGLVFGVSDAVALAAGKGHTCALQASGGVLCWGHNGYSQLGKSSSVYVSTTPVVVEGISNAITVAAGEDHSCALKAGGSVRCWGWNDHGQLGNGSTVSSYLVVPVNGLSDVVALAAGGSHTCAVQASGSVRCWGHNNHGQLGNGSTVDSTTPVAVTGVSDAVALAVGYTHTCALLTSGSVQCWGDNSGGALGNGNVTFTAVVSPVTVVDMKDAVAITAGEWLTCALHSDNSVSCWGSNIRGQLGDSFREAHASSPVKVTGLNGVVALGTATEHTCALLKSGDLRCWGWNVTGQLGDGTHFDRGNPTSVLGGPVFWK
jgi:alpha-tubulin suppressor-like RCC1 family protein